MDYRRYLILTLVCGAALGAGGTGVAFAQEAAKPAAKDTVPADWPYRPLIAPALPSVQDTTRWVRTPIDKFVLAKLEEKGLTPSREADRITLVRRLYLDVTGIVPTPEEVKSFVNDKSPNAYENLVDKLLASPQYGERIGRRWLDLARYADTQGFQDDEQRPGMWRYRDYVIKSFNEDKPFNLFVREQIAGDELWPGKQEALVATGFLRGYPDAPDHRDLLEKRYNSITDMTDTVGTVLLGHSVECARCHNHKFDKISMKDYYQLQSFFANTLPSDNLPVLEKGEKERKFEQDYAVWEEQTKSIRARLAAFIEPYRDEIIKYHRERFYEDGRASLLKPKSEWKSLDRWLNYRFDQYIVRNNPNYGWDVSFFAAANGAFNNAVEIAAVEPGFDPKQLEKLKTRRDEYRKLLAELREYNNKRPEQGATIISGLTENGTDAAPQHIYSGGDHLRPLEEVQPGFPALITPAYTTPKITPTANSSGRRTALANWLVSPENVVVPRVFANRLWAHYFDKGIVLTVSDFGRAGQKPTHPELLDWLADSFVKEGWSVKKLTRKILLSSVYRQSSTERGEVIAADPTNKLLAVFPRKRMDTEQVRDSLLAVAGLLDKNKQNGPGVYPTLPEAVYKASARNVPGFWPQTNEAKDQYTRSVYVYVRRSLPYPLLETYDGPSPQLPHSVRDVTVSPQQALTLFNNDLVYDWSKNLAGRVIREAGSKEEAQIDRLFQILFGRSPDKEEQRLAIGFLNQHEKVIKEQLASGKLAIAVPKGLERFPDTNPTRLSAFVDLAHALANSNEFVYRF
jgi:hypothetical protein